jgi:hypothetical protein
VRYRLAEAGHGEARRSCCLFCQDQGNAYPGSQFVALLSGTGQMPERGGGAL